MIVLGDDLLRGAVEIAGAGVITEAGPKFEDVLLPGARERFDGGEASKKTVVVGNHSGDAGLLQHDFGDPDAVGIAAAAPGEIAAMAAKPGEEMRLKARR